MIRCEWPGLVTTVNLLEMRRCVLLLLAVGAAVIVLGVMVVSRMRRDSSSAAAGPPVDARMKSANGSAEVDLEVHGRVLEHDGPEVGKAIAGAVVHVDGSRRDEQTVPADESGSFRLAGDLASLQALRVEAEGYAGEELDSETLRASAEYAGPKGIPFYLKRGSRIAGRVTADGTGVASARVRCVQRGINNSADFGASVVSGSDGEFAVMCGNGEFKVQASHPEYRRGVSGWLTRDQMLTHSDCGRAGTRLAPHRQGSGRARQARSRRTSGFEQYGRRADAAWLDRVGCRSSRARLLGLSRRVRIRTRQRKAGAERQGTRQSGGENAAGSHHPA